MGTMRIPAVVAITLALAGCGQPAPPAGDSPRETAPPAGDSPRETAPPTAEPMYSCFGPAYPASAWTGGRPAEDVEHPGRETLRDEVAPEGLAGWFVVEASEDFLAIARERESALAPGDDMLRTHDFVSVRDVGGDVGWHLDQWSSCSPRLVLDGLAPVEVWLGGEPDPTASSVGLLVKEIGCAGGQSAEGRLRLVRLEERADEVELVVAVEPRGGPQSCPGNPHTPMTVELDEPLGDRELIDGSVLPARPLQTAPRTAGG